MRTVVYSGLVVNLIGAALDFESGYTLTPMAGEGMVTSDLYAVALYALGVAVFIGGVVLMVGARSPASDMARMMKRSGVLMEVFGVAMVLVSAWLPGMDVIMSDAMLVVGALMILNGALMQRGNKTQMK